MIFTFFFKFTRADSLCLRIKWKSASKIIYFKSNVLKWFKLSQKLKNTFLFMHSTKLGKNVLVWKPMIQKCVCNPYWRQTWLQIHIRWFLMNGICVRIENVSGASDYYPFEVLIFYRVHFSCVILYSVRRWLLFF